MKVVLQRVSRAAVRVDGAAVGEIGQGYLLLFCVEEGDTSLQAQLLAEKIVKLRLWPGADGQHNHRSLLEIGGEALVVSQFTLAGDTAKGSRPDYTKAAPPDEANMLYEYFIGKLRELTVVKVEAGVFAAHMQVELVNDGPVTLILER